MSELGDHLAATGVSQLLSGLGDSVTHWPAGVEADAATVDALLDRSSIANELGDLSDQHGEKILLAISIGVSPAVEVTWTLKGGGNSVFVVDGERWEVDRRLSLSAGLAIYRAVRWVQKTTRQSRR